MPITITSAVVHDLYVNFVGGVAVNLMSNYSYTDSNGNTGNGTYRKPLTPAQQTSIDNFVNGLISQLQTDLNITITLD